MEHIDTNYDGQGRTREQDTSSAMRMLVILAAFYLLVVSLALLGIIFLL